MRRFVTIDLETTGLDPTQHQIIEAAVIVETPRGTEVRAFSLPFIEEMASPEALEINGWGKREFAPMAPSPSWAAGLLDVVTDDAFIVGKNPQFDVGFLKAFLEQYRITPNWHHRLIDVGALAWGYYNRGTRANMSAYGRTGELITPIAEPPTTDGVADLLGILRKTMDGFHTAALDADWAYRVFRHIVPRER